MYRARPASISTRPTCDAYKDAARGQQRGGSQQQAVPRVQAVKRAAHRHLAELEHGRGPVPDDAGAGHRRAAGPAHAIPLLLLLLRQLSVGAAASTAADAAAAVWLLRRLTTRCISSLLVARGKREADAGQARSLP